MDRIRNINWAAMKQIAVTILLGGLPTLSYASGLDLTVLHGARQVALGGQQIAVADDAYAPFYNPAGLMGIETAEIVVNHSPFLFQYEAPLGAPNTSRNSELNFGPFFYLGGAYRVNDMIVVGMAVYPTALQGGKFKNVDYSDGLTGKDYSLKLVRIEFSPTVSFQLHKHFAIGASYRFGYTKLENKTGIFGGTVGAFLDTNVSAWDGKGFKTSAYIHDLNGFYLAVAHRFGMRTTLKGTTNIEDDSTGLLGGAPSASVPVRLDLNIPSKTQLGLAYEWIDDTFMTALSLEYTQNTDLKTLTLVNRATETAVSSAQYNYKDTISVHIGGEYTFDLAGDDRLRTNAGFSFDQAASRPSLPNPVGPPAEHYKGVSVGSQYLMTHHAFGLALNYGQYSETSTTIDNPVAGAVFAGKYGIKSFLAALDYKYTF